MSDRAFDLGDILSVTTGRLVSPRHIAGVYDILNFLTGDNLWTHQLPRAAAFARPGLFAQHPDLATVEEPQLSGEGEVLAWLGEAKARYGDSRALTPLDGWNHQNPIEELSDLVGPERVWVATVPEAKP